MFFVWVLMSDKIRVGKFQTNMNDGHVKAGCWSTGMSLSCRKTNGNPFLKLIHARHIGQIESFYINLRARKIAESRMDGTIYHKAL